MPAGLIAGLLNGVDAAAADRPGRVIVGIAGPPGAGKSTLAAAVVRSWRARGGADAALMPMDGFHLSGAQLERLGRRDRRGAPDTFDVAGYVATLQRVRAGYPDTEVYLPDFDRSLDEPVAAGLVVPAAARLVITEGNYLAVDTGGWQHVRALVDMLIYLDVPAALRRRRLIERHTTGGRDAAVAARWVAAVDDPNAATVASSRWRCDRTVTVGG